MSEHGIVCEPAPGTAWERGPEPGYMTGAEGARGAALSEDQPHLRLGLWSGLGTQGG